MRQRSANSKPPANSKGTNSISSFCRSAVAKLPSSQNTMLGSFSSVSARYCIRLTQAEKKPLRITPASTKERILRRAMALVRVKISSSAAMPKTKADSSSAANGRLSRIASVPPNAAPEDTPIICGSTSGLRKTPCKAAPHRASAAPAPIANSTRGTRTPRITWRWIASMPA